VFSSPNIELQFNAVCSQPARRYKLDRSCPISLPYTDSISDCFCRRDKTVHFVPHMVLISTHNTRYWRGWSHGRSLVVHSIGRLCLCLSNWTITFEWHNH